MISPHDLRELLATLPPEATLPLGWLRQAGILSPQEDPLPRDLTVDDVANLIGRSPPTVRRLARDGTLRGYRQNGREWRFPRSAVREYQEGQRGDSDAA